MADHLILLSARGAPEFERARAAPGGELLRAGWIRAHAAAAAEVWTRGTRPAPVTVTPDGEGLIVGDAFRRPAAWPVPEIDGAAPARACSVLRTLWGGFVAVWPASASRGAEILRDPSGAQEALIWGRAGLLLVASRLSAPGLSRLLPPVGVDRDQLARCVVDGGEAAGPLALTGVTAVTAGAVWREGATEAQAWTPAGAAGGSLDAGREEATRALRGRVDEVARAWTALGRPLVGEISGGLDSAITACAFAGGDAVRRWITFHEASAEGDERAYARQVAVRLGIALTEIARRDPGWEADALAETADACRPPLTAMDVEYDRAVAAELRAVDAGGLVTGQGGDAVFFNLRTPLIVARRVERAGRAAADDEEVRRAAAWLRTNTAAVVRACRRAARPSWRPPATRRLGAAPQLADVQRSGPRHPWLRGLATLAPAKRLQVAAVVQASLMSLESRRTRAARPLHLPLQPPVLELAMGLPADVLAFGGRDRALARTAFADRLPSAVLERRGKGDLTASFGRALGRVLPMLRERLLGGELRRLDLLDVDALEARLRPEPLMLEGGYGDLMDLLAMETWTAHWRSRPV